MAGERCNVVLPFAQRWQTQAHDVEAVEEVWHGLKPPYLELFAWGEGRGAQPTAKDVPVFRPFMLAHPLEEADLAALHPGRLVPDATHASPGDAELPPFPAEQDAAYALFTSGSTGIISWASGSP